MAGRRNSLTVKEKSNLAVGLIASFLFIALASLSQGAEWASLKGRFVFDGTPPAPAEITADKDVEVCGKHKLVNEELVVSDDKGIANVVLFVRSKDVTVHPIWKTVQSRSSCSRQ